MKGLIVEKNPAKIKLNDSNLLVADIEDMQQLEDWEERLDKAGQIYATAFRMVAERVVYSIFTKVRKKGSIFR